jgi:hypothetical protein
MDSNSIGILTHQYLLLSIETPLIKFALSLISKKNGRFKNILGFEEYINVRFVKKIYNF